MMEEFVLSHGLNFCLSPNSVEREEVFAKFEVLIGQLFHHVPHSLEQFSVLNARLSDLAHDYCGNSVDISNSLILKSASRQADPSDAMKISLTLNLTRVLGLSQ